MTARNPNWHRDELILALDLYFQHDLGTKSGSVNQRHPDVVALSQLLNNLPIQSDRPDAEHFRNPNGVYMKLMNFRSVDPGYEGKGLSRGAKEREAALLSEFAGRRDELARLARMIREGHETVPAADESEEDEFPEGKVIYRLHRRRERNRGLAKKKKNQVREAHGRLACEVCGFDFAEVYGEDFIECHHDIPVSELRAGSKTRLADLSLVCANCHRMLHHHRPWLSVAELAERIRNRRRA